MSESEPQMLMGDGREINEHNEEIPDWARPYITTLKAQVNALERERDAWRDVAVVHGAEVQADNDYLIRSREPLVRENARLQQLVADLSQRKSLRTRLVDWWHRR